MVQFTRMKVVRNDEGQQVVLTRNGEILLLDPKGREFEKYEVPAGATCSVNENQEVRPGTVLCRWDPHSIPILAEVGGKVRYEDVIDGETIRLEKDPGGHVRMIVTEYKGDLHPQVVLEEQSGKILDFSTCPKRPTSRCRKAARSLPARCSPKRRARSPARRTSPAVCRA